MRILPIALVAVLAGCATSNSVEPVPGSLTYQGRPTPRLAKAPIGSQVKNRFRDDFAHEWGETYIVQPDRSLKLVERHRIEYPDS